jgi:hypothetical protein
VKSPIELVVGTLHVLELRPDETLPFAVAAAGMGQNLFSPPNVKGWPGGEAWINTTTLLARKAFVDRVARGDDVPSLATHATVETDQSDGGSMNATPTANAALKPVAAAASDSAAARRQRFLERMERGASSIRFDSAKWLAELPGNDPIERANRARRLLLAVAPQHPIDAAAEPLALVGALLLDPAYQLK